MPRRAACLPDRHVTRCLGILQVLVDVCRARAQQPSGSARDTSGQPGGGRPRGTLQRIAAALAHPRLPGPRRIEGPAGAAWYRASRTLAERTRALYRARLERDDFTIICSNCWGGEAYRHLEVPYRTPFVGLFIEPPDYVRLLGDLRAYLTAPMEFVERSKYDNVNRLRDSGERSRYPIAILGGDVEINFQHETSAEEAESKWRRRTERIVWDNLRVAMLEYGLREEPVLGEYAALPYAHKLLLTPEDRPELDIAYRVRATFSNAAAVYYQTLGQFDVVRWLNDGAREAPPSLVRQWRAPRAA